MSTKQDKLTAHFRTSKQPAAPSAAGKARSNKRQKKDEAPAPEAVARSEGDAAVSNVDLPEEEQLLRRFDLQTKYGPCAGITRLERWERAQKFGLQPPEDVRRVLLGKRAGDPAHQSLWAAQNI